MAGGLSHSQELEVSLHSGLYLLVFNKRGIDRSVKAELLINKVEMLQLMEVEDWKEQSLRDLIIMLSYSIRLFHPSVTQPVHGGIISGAGKEES